MPQKLLHKTSNYWPSMPPQKYSVRDRRQKTFGFLNRLCLLISNPLPPLINRQPWFFMIQHPYFILILVLVAHTYTIYTCIYTVYIPILYLFYTRILYFFTVYYTSIKNIYMIQPPILHSLCFHLVACRSVNFSRYHAC